MNWPRRGIGVIGCGRVGLARTVVLMAEAINDKNATIELKITGMTCDHCKRAVEKALATVPNVQTVSVDGPNGHATIRGVPNVEALFDAVRSEGYDVELLAQTS